MESRNSHILSFLENKTANFSDRIAVGMKSKYGWTEMTYKGVGLISRKIARYLIEDLKIKKGECLAILSESKPEFAPCVFASILAGTITVPLDIKLSKYELHSILSDCQPTVLITSEHYLETAIYLQKEIPSIRCILVNDAHAKNEGIKNIYELPDEYEAKWRQRSSKSTALIIYTSGTTGAPKGVEISFSNMYAQLEDLNEVVNNRILKGKKSTILSILPMNHLFELTMGFSTFLSFGHTIYYTTSLKPNDITSVMKEKGVEFMLVVPAFLKLLKTGIEKQINSLSNTEKCIFKFLYHIAKFLPSFKIRRKLFSNLLSSFGDNFHSCLSGGAQLDAEVGNFFERLGIRVYQGYGLSESSPVVSVNYDRQGDFASVGPALSLFEAITDSKTGELLLKGPSVMKGYHNQPELTAEVIDSDGWLHTGDVAKIDKRTKHIYITGRIKNMIVLQGGKKVFPEEVEAVLQHSKYIQELCILGTKKDFGAKNGTEEVTAVIVPKKELFETYSKDDVEKMIKADIKSLSERLTLYKRPTKIIINEEPLPRTATQKVKRKEVKALIGV